MADEADGSVRIVYDVDIAQARKQVADLSKELDQQKTALKKLQYQYDAVKKAQESSTGYKSIDSYNDEIKKATVNIEVLESKIKALSESAFGDLTPRIDKMIEAERKGAWGKNTESLAKGQRTQLGINEEYYQIYKNGLSVLASSQTKLKELLS